jgi:hypothetical protein
MGKNLQGQILTLTHRETIGPEDEIFWVYEESLKWHQAEVYRRR